MSSNVLGSVPLSSDVVLKDDGVISVRYVSGDRGPGWGGDRGPGEEGSVDQGGERSRDQGGERSGDQGGEEKGDQGLGSRERKESSRSRARRDWSPGGGRTGVCRGGSMFQRRRVQEKRVRGGGLGSRI